MLCYAMLCYSVIVTEAVQPDACRWSQYSGEKQIVEWRAVKEVDWNKAIYLFDRYDYQCWCLSFPPLLPFFPFFPFLSFDMEIVQVTRDCVSVLHFPSSVVFNLRACLFLSPFLFILYSNAAYQCSLHASWYPLAPHSIAWHGIAWYSMQWYGMAVYITVWHHILVLLVVWLISCIRQQASKLA